MLKQLSAENGILVSLKRLSSARRTTMSVDNRGTTDVPRWYYSFMIRGVRYFGSIPEARTKAEALKVEAMKRLEVYEGRYGKEPGVKDFCEFVDQVYMEYAKSNKATWKHDLFRSETLKEHFGGLRFRDITPRSVEKFILGRLDSDSRRKSKRSPVSVHKEFSLLSSIFNMAMREEVAACNPCLKISKKLGRRSRPETNAIGSCRLKKRTSYSIWDSLVRVPIFDRSSDWVFTLEPDLANSWQSNGPTSTSVRSLSP